MPPYPNSSPLKDINIRKLVGSALYVEIALSTDMEWRTSVIEKLIDQDRYEEPMGRYRKMLYGIIPSNKICKRIQKKLQCGDLIKWRNHPYWCLLCDSQSGHVYIEKALFTVKRSMRGYIWSEPDVVDAKDRSTRIEPTLEVVKGVAAFKNLYALITLTAWAREAREHHFLRPNYQCALYSRKIFAHVICNTPHLFVRWPLLAKYYKNFIWSFPDSKASEPWFDMEWNELIDEIELEEEKARSKRIKLPPKHYFRHFNKNN